MWHQEYNILAFFHRTVCPLPSPPETFTSLKVWSEDSGKISMTDFASIPSKNLTTFTMSIVLGKGHPANTSDKEISKGERNELF